jgi:hypothetical protein
LSLISKAVDLDHPTGEGLQLISREATVAGVGDCRK